MILTSTAFQNGKAIPERYSCKGEDISPPLFWDDAPKGTQSFVIIADDPDAPMGTWVHWVYYNIPPQLHSLHEDVSPVENPGTGGIQGITSFGTPGYGGPCPPSGTHRYFFKLYAVDDNLNLRKGADKKQVEKAMKGRVLAEAELMGTFGR